MEVGYLTILFRDVFYRHNRPRWRLRGTIVIALFLFGHVTDFSLLTRLISSLGTRTSIEEFSREEKSIESFLRHSSPSNCTAERGRKFGLRNSALPKISHPVSSLKLFRRIRGVFPTVSIKPFLISIVSSLYIYFFCWYFFLF